MLLFDNNVKNEVENLAFGKRDDSFFKVGQKGGEEKDIVKIMKERHQNLFELSNALPVWQTDLTDEYRQDSHYTRQYLNIDLQQAKALTGMINAKTYETIIIAMRNSKRGISDGGKLFDEQ